jgi:hypothetical protein
MTISEEMQKIVEELIAKYGPRYEVDLKELYELFWARFQRGESSIRPKDFCYNRVNKGIKFFDWPRLFEYVEPGLYRCLGENFSYTGETKNSRDGIVVGTWKNGTFTKNEHWGACGLK